MNKIKRESCALVQVEIENFQFSIFNISSKVD